jgi:hypothetical protein
MVKRCATQYVIYRKLATVLDQYLEAARDVRFASSAATRLSRVLVVPGSNTGQDRLCFICMTVFYVR